MKENSSVKYSTDTVGTVQYMAPESLQFSVYSSASDVYAVGVVAWELFTEQEVFAGMTDFEIGDLVVSKKFRPSLESMKGILDRRVVDVVLDCMAFNPADRPSSSVVCETLQACIGK